MTIGFAKNKLLAVLLTFSLLATSFGGVFALPAAAASEASTGDTVKDGVNTGLLAAIAAVGLIAVLSGGSSGDNADPAKNPGSGQSSGSGQTGGSGSTSDEQLAFSLLNKDRAANGLAALKANAQLSQLARSYAADMINRGYFSHNNPEGLTPFDRMKQAGISYSYAGENLAINTDVTAAEAAFMNSSGHRANILSPKYTEVGIGVVRNARGQVYVVQEFIGR
jgi:uncharacterized protein YkwD